MNVIDRVKGIILNPKSEWQAIEGEQGTPGFLFSNYVAIVAAVPAIASFIGSTIIGYGGFRFGLIVGLLHAAFMYGLTFVGVYVVAYVIDFLAGTFGGRKGLENAMRVSAYAPTAAWVAGVFNIIPALAFLSVLGLYSLYLLHTGIVALMKPAPDKAVLYTVTAIVCVIVIWMVIAWIPAMILGMRMAM